MSFILDALKKSDRKRQQHSAPRIDSVHRSVMLTDQRRWLLRLLVPLLLILIGLAFWLLPSNPPVLERPVAAVIEQADTKVEKPPASAPVTSTAPAHLENQSPSAAPISTQPHAEAASQQLTPLTGLPPKVRQQVQQMHISLHAFHKADPAASLVRIDEQILREGEQFHDGYTVVEIVADGAILQQQGYRFLLPRKGR